ncbi:L-type lectin-domain containing receptor kinase S.5 [Pyrus ussuriensis x Pyrus communis]|uniref:L-type lectin-domain containing receptor kinase S.5 n=1 Tax=Pyrus ussuriensis x Pyrus communis TaxID=2448454 RepID=A0A5N5GIJ0_9ROSA|nr:L-type lectin-domain containing receptor kinase S.5 [Pyrus ussuriensis x Pyrus communis]
MAWHGPRFRLPRLGCLLKMRKLLKFDFSATVNEAVKNRVAKIGVAEGEVLDERIVGCKVAATP